MYNNLDRFKKEKKGQLIWCCGLGKTYMSLFICYKLKFKKILICVPSIYILLQFEESIKKAFGINPICVYVDSKNKDDIKNLNINDIVIVLSTYHSCKKVLDITNFKFDIKIGDEAHHLVTSKKNNDNFTFDKFHEINSEYSLFMTATQKDIIDRKKNIYTMSNKEDFGEIIDSKNIDWAIKNGYITNYNIICIMNNYEEINYIYKALILNYFARMILNVIKKNYFCSI